MGKSSDDIIDNCHRHFQHDEVRRPAFIGAIRSDHVYRHGGADARVRLENRLPSHLRDPELDLPLFVFAECDAFGRLGQRFHPRPIDGWLVVWTASIALAVDLATVVLLSSMARDSLNVRAAMLHNLADALTSAGVAA